MLITRVLLLATKRKRAAQSSHTEPATPRPSRATRQRRSRVVQARCTHCSPSSSTGTRGVCSRNDVFLTLVFPAFAVAGAAQVEHPATHPQTITVLKSKVGRPPKKKPKFGQWNSHFTESVMTKPLLRVEARAVASSAPISSSSASHTASLTPAVPELLPPSLAVPPLQCGLADCLQMAQLQYIQVQQRLSALLTLAHIQQPSAALSAASGLSVSAPGFGACGLHPYLHGASQLPHAVLPQLDGRLYGQVALAQLGNLQQSAQRARDQELMMALAASQNQGPAFFEQLQHVGLAQNIMMNHLSSNQLFRPSCSKP
jgi:hypothetical protein